MGGNDENNFVKCVVNTVSWKHNCEQFVHDYYTLMIMLRFTMLRYTVSLLRCLELSYKQMDAEILSLSFLQNFHASKIATYMVNRRLQSTKLLS